MTNGRQIRIAKQITIAERRSQITSATERKQSSITRRPTQLSKSASVSQSKKRMTIEIKRTSEWPSRSVVSSSRSRPITSAKAIYNRKTKKRHFTIVKRKANDNRGANNKNDNRQSKRKNGNKSLGENTISCLCKPARVIHTFVVMCHPCFVTCQTFSFTSPAPLLDSLTFFLSLAAPAAFTLPKLMLTHHCWVSTKT